MEEAGGSCERPFICTSAQNPEIQIKLRDLDHLPNKGARMGPSMGSIRRASFLWYLLVEEQDRQIWMVTGREHKIF